MHVDNISADSGSEERSERQMTDKQKPSDVQRNRLCKCAEVVETYFQLVQKLPIEVRQSVLQPIYEERRILQFYLDESKRLTEVGDMNFMYNKDKERIRNHDKRLRAIKKYANLEKGQKELRKSQSSTDPRRYHDIVRVQGTVLAHLRECYTI